MNRPSPLQPDASPPGLVHDCSKLRSPGGGGPGSRRWVTMSTNALTTWIHRCARTTSTLPQSLSAWILWNKRLSWEMYCPHCRNQGTTGSHTTPSDEKIYSEGLVESLLWRWSWKPCPLKTCVLQELLNLTLTHAPRKGKGPPRNAEMPWNYSAASSHHCRKSLHCMHLFPLISYCSGSIPTRAHICSCPHTHI